MTVHLKMQFTPASCDHSLQFIRRADGSKEVINAGASASCFGMLVARCGGVSEGCTDCLTAGTFRPAEHTHICEKVGGVPAPGLMAGAVGGRMFTLQLAQLERS